MQIVSRLPDGEFFNREAELARLYALAGRGQGSAALATEWSAAGATQDAPTAIGERARGERAREEGTGAPRRAANALVLGAPRVGKTELLRRTFDRFFREAREVVPFYFALRPYHREPQRFASHYLAHYLSQFIAFRRQNARLLALANEPLQTIAQNALPDDYQRVQHLVQAFEEARQSGDEQRLVRGALAAPSLLAGEAQVMPYLMPYLMLDNFHLLAEAGSEEEGRGEGAALALLRAEFIRVFAAQETFGVTPEAGAASVYVLCGLRRLITEMLPAEEGVFDNLELLRIETMAEMPLERMIRATAARLRLDLSDSTAELMMQQLGGDLFYTRALLDAAATDGARLRSFMEFERLYTTEVLQGRICHYLNAVLREVAADRGGRRACLEALMLAVEAASPTPIEAALERMTPFTETAKAAESLLLRLHARELLEISYGFVSAASDTVLCDYVRAKYRTEVAGARRPVAGEELLGEKLKHSYSLMMTRYNRSVEQQLVDLLSRFDFQAAPASLLDVEKFAALHHGQSRAEARQTLEEEAQHVRLPQIVLVNELGNCEIHSAACRLYSAGGFDGGIYSEANEALWMIALVNAREPLEVGAAEQLEARLQAAARSAIFGNQAIPVCWFISKEGFTNAARQRLREAGAHLSTYTQLDLLYDYLVKLSPREDELRASSEVELIIPIEDEAELIAARTVEQIARAADFDKESINQIKTALIEACINAAEHGDSPDRKIYHRFAIIDDRLVISVSNRGKAFAGVPAPTDGNDGKHLRGTRGRGLKIIRGLMDDVHFERNEEGTTLVMTKLLKHRLTQ